MSNLKTNFEITDRHSKFQDDIKLMGPKSNFWRINSINQKVGSYWNELDISIKKIADKSLSTFTCHVKRCYISKYSTTCSINDCYICSI